MARGSPRWHQVPSTGRRIRGLAPAEGGAPDETGLDHAGETPAAPYLPDDAGAPEQTPPTSGTPPTSHTPPTSDTPPSTVPDAGVVRTPPVSPPPSGLRLRSVHWTSPLAARFRPGRIRRRRVERVCTPLVQPSRRWHRRCRPQTGSRSRRRGAGAGRGGAGPAPRPRRRGFGNAPLDHGADGPGECTLSGRRGITPAAGTRQNDAICACAATSRLSHELRSRHASETECVSWIGLDVASRSR